MGRGPEPVHWACVQKTFRTCLSPHCQAAGGQGEDKPYTHCNPGKTLNLFEPQRSYLKTEQIIYPDNHTGGEREQSDEAVEG